MSPKALPVLNETLGDEKPLRILMAEDNLINQKVIQRILGKLGYRSDIASNGAEAVMALKQQAYDVVFMDIQMPQITGIEFLKTLKKPPKVVITTAYREYALDGFEQVFHHAFKHVEDVVLMHE